MNGRPNRMKVTERVEAPRGPGHGMIHGQVGQKAMTFGPSLRRLLGHLRPQARKLAMVAGSAVTAVALAAVGPRILGRATDIVFAGAIGSRLPEGMTRAEAIESARATGQGQIADLLSGIDFVPGAGIDFSALAGVLLLAVGVYALSSLLSYLQGWLLTDVVQSTIYRLRSQVEDKLNRLPLRYFDHQPRGELLSRVTNDIDNVSQSLQHTLSQVLTSVLTVAFVVSMMFVISPTLALIALVTIPVTMVIAGVIMKRSQKQFIAQWRHTGTLNGQIEEAFTGHSLVKVFGRHREIQERFEVDNEELYRSSFSAQFLSGLIMPTMMFIGNINYVLIAVIGGLRVASGTLSLGDVQAFIQYSRQFTQPVTQLASMVNLLQSGVASAERVFELLDEDEEQSEDHKTVLPAASRGEIALEGVSFRYEEDEPLIEDLSLTVRPGQMVAIVGPTGAGKTTLVNLIMRFYELDAGRITMDGIDVDSIPRSDLRSQVGMVLQDTWLFHGTIRENIAYGRPDATEEEIMEAARATFVDRFVHSLPDGYDTVIDEEGSNISAGEKQLITIARAFLAEPALLILDEATSSVDTRTEQLVQHAMAALRTNRTSFVIAHRLSTVRDADLILMMESGRIVERGTHDELIALGSAYADLYNSQFSGPDVDPEPRPTASTAPMPASSPRPAAAS